MTTEWRDSKSGDSSGAVIRFLFEGRLLEAQKGDTIASALLRNDVSVLGRSSGPHRPRGYRCGHGHCSCCAMRVGDGLSWSTHLRHACSSGDECGGGSTRGLRPTTTFCEVQKLLTPLDAAGLLLPLVSPLASPLRGVREGDSLKSRAKGRCRELRPRRGWPKPAAKLETSTCLWSVQAWPDCRPRWRLPATDGGCSSWNAMTSWAGDTPTTPYSRVTRGRRRAAPPTFRAFALLPGDSERIEVLTDAEAIGWYEEGLIAIDTHPDLLLVDASAVVLATGAYELGQPFPNSDLPGVMLASGGSTPLGSSSRTSR